MPLIVNKELRILVVEDVAADVMMINHELRRSGLAFRSKRVETREDFVRELQENPPDLIFSDHGLPSFDGFAALAVAQKKCPEVPFIFVTGSNREEVAAQTFKRGATDYVLKNQLSNLVPAVRRALQLAEERARRKEAEQALQKSERRYRRLVELCSNALFVRSDNRIVFANSAAAQLRDAVRRCLNIKFKKIGHMTTLSIDSKNRIINLKLDLNGEPAPVEVNIRGYALREETGTAFLELGIIETSREWITALLEQHFKLRRLEVTGWEKLIQVLL